MMGICTGIPVCSGIGTLPLVDCWDIMVAVAKAGTVGSVSGRGCKGNDDVRVSFLVITVTFSVGTANVHCFPFTREHMGGFNSDGGGSITNGVGL
jgi:hypothetical protein